MAANPFVGVIFHWLGGLASGSFYVPYRQVKKWSWEVSWLVGGFFSWIIAPWVMAIAITGVLFPVLREAPASSCFWAYFWGAMWGLGGLTFGLTMRYLGMSLGMAVALSYCSVFGTLMPPLFNGTLVDKFSTTSGLWIAAGIVVCVLGIVVTGMAGVSKDREMSEEKKREAIKEFSFWKGILVATFSGVMSASFSYGLAAGDPIKDLTLKHSFLKAAQADGLSVTNPLPIASADEKTLWEEMQKSQVPAVARMVKSLASEKTVHCGAVATYMEKCVGNAEADTAALASFLTQSQNPAAVTLCKSKYFSDYQTECVANARAEVDAIASCLSQSQSPAAAELVKYDAERSKIQDPEVRRQPAAYSSFDLKRVAVQIASAGGDMNKYVAKHTLWQGLPVLVVVLLGGFTTNFIWCILLNLKNRTGYQYFNSTLRRQPAAQGADAAGSAVADAPKAERVPMLNNYFFCAVAGVTWYLQFFFYTMGETQMGNYKFSSWTLHMASIIIFSSLWGIALKEWKGSGAGTKRKLSYGLAMLILSTIIIGYGNYLGA
ncbi:MAG: L-rhamnose/proton symporter RhaT [Phycisphaerales bacterium]